MKTLKLKTILTTVVAALLLVIIAFMMAGCSKEPDPKERVMNLELNPEVEFILDTQNKVVSVSAKNDEGNFIIAQANFVGLTAEEATNKFLEVSKDAGFIVEADFADNELEISISSDDGNKLYDKIKKSATNYLKDLNLNITIDLGDAITKDDLRELVQECMKEYSFNDLAQKSEAELIALLETSREQTKNLNTQELKDMYYDLRANQIELAKFEALKAQLEGNPEFALISTALETAVNQLQSASDSIKNYYVTNFLDADSTYQKAMKQFVAKKQELLQAKLDGALTEGQYNTLNQQLEAIETQIEYAEDSVETLIDSAQSTIQTAISTINNLVTNINNFAGRFGAQMETAKNTAIANFEAQFDAEYAEYINANYWDGLKVS